MEIENFIIDDIKLQHAEGIAAISYEVRNEFYWGIHVPIGSYYTTSKFEEFLSSTKFVFGKVALAQNKVVGATWINLYDDWEASILITKEYRGSGIAQILVEVLRKEISKDKIVDVWVLEKNIASVKLCKKLGFEVIQKKIIDDCLDLNGDYCFQFKMLGLK